MRVAEIVAESTVVHDVRPEAGVESQPGRGVYRKLQLRSPVQGGGQYGALWGDDYRRTANDNIMIVAMIENPAGAAMADRIAAVPGVDVVFVASTDLGSFSGFRQGDAKYEALVTRVLETTAKAGLKVGGPLAWKDTRQGCSFFQGPGETALLRTGIRTTLGGQPATPGQQRGVAPIEGTNR